MAEINKAVKQQFGKIAKNYVYSPIHSSQADLDFAISIINPFARELDNWTVLDVGTGTGHLAFSLSRYVSLVLATDITPEMLEQLSRQKKERNINNVTIKEADVHDLPYPDNSFNMVTTRMAPHHFHSIEIAIKEMVRVTRPGGLIFVEDVVCPKNQEVAEFFHELEVIRDPSHLRDFSVTEWQSLFEKNNCAQLQAETKLFPLQIKAWAKRVETPPEGIKKMLDIVKNANALIKHHLQIIQEEEDVAISPSVGYFVFQKPEA